MKSRGDTNKTSIVLETHNMMTYPSALEMLQNFILVLLLKWRSRRIVRSNGDWTIPPSAWTAQSKTSAEALYLDSKVLSDLIRQAIAQMEAGIEFDFLNERTTSIFLWWMLLSTTTVTIAAAMSSTTSTNNMTGDVTRPWWLHNNKANYPRCWALLVLNYF